MELVVGRIAKAHGVTGELSVEIRTDDPDERFAVGSVLTGRLPRGAVIVNSPSNRYVSTPEGC